MEQLIIPRPHQALPLPMASAHGQDANADPEGAFWCAAIGRGAALALELAPRIDVFALRSAQLPFRNNLTRPVVGQYLCMVKSLAAAWSLHSRPALLAALGNLASFGASAGQSYALEAMAARCADNGRAARRVVDALQRRLALPLAAFDSLSTELAGYLAQVARATCELDADTCLVTQRLQADQVHAFLLSQQASALQGKVDEAGMRAHAGWLAGPHDHALRQECAAHGCALEGVRRQLEQLRAEQAATGAEAAYLQSLLPTVAPLLSAAERLAWAIGDIHAGIRLLAERLAQLRVQLGAEPDAAAHAPAQLTAAAPQWQALAAALTQLQAGGR